jgi:hypothetical protein
MADDDSGDHHDFEDVEVRSALAPGVRRCVVRDWDSSHTSSMHRG